MKWIWLDDVRIPIQNLDKWVITKNYKEFCEAVKKIGLDDIELISLDHDLGETAMQEYFRNNKNFIIDYNNIQEPTGLDCAKWLVNYSLEKNIPIPQEIYSHSANPIGASNIIGYINNYFKNQKLPQTCKRIKWDFIIKQENE